MLQRGRGAAHPSNPLGQRGKKDGDRGAESVGASSRVGGVARGKDREGERESEGESAAACKGHRGTILFTLVGKSMRRSTTQPTQPHVCQLYIAIASCHSGGLCLYTAARLNT